MTNTLDMKLQQLGFTAELDYQLALDENGDPFIFRWMSSKPRPGQGAISAADPAQLIERKRIAAIDAKADAHIDATFPSRDREMAYARVLATLDGARRGRPAGAQENARVDGYMALLSWVDTVHGERDQAIAAGTAPDKVSFTAWTG